MSLAKRARTTLHPRHQMKLDTVRGVAGEQGRLYRLWINGKIKSNEMTAGIFGLREIRQSIEVAIDMAPAADKAPTTLRVISVPVDHYVRSTSGLEVTPGRLAIEHRPSEEPVAASTHDSESNTIDRAQDVEQSQAEQEIIENLKREINQLAQRLGSDIVV